MSNHQQSPTTRKLWHVSFNSLCWECLEKDNNDDDVGGHDYVYMPIIMKMIGNTLSCSKVLNLSLDITRLINWFFTKDVHCFQGVAVGQLSLIEMKTRLRNGASDASAARHVHAPHHPTVQLFQRAEIEPIFKLFSAKSHERHKTIRDAHPPPNNF